MPRYFIDATIGPHLYRDVEGAILRDDLCAHDLAVATLHDLARLTTAEGRDAPVSATVRTERDTCVCTVRMDITTDWSAAGDLAATERRVERLAGRLRQAG
ncbi:DUF6894 family protein [Methylobacterium nigriterrae]|uniref:DUF6894 family protein n=1 Tax=Methylobacterium nigriterrae TaxID=3127512 RepID=UPI0030141179